MGKAEHLPDKANPRFVVTSLPAEEWDARALYEELYCARGDMENRIKEQQPYQFAERTSAATMRANQTRLYFPSVSFLLIEAARRLGLETLVRDGIPGPGPREDRRYFFAGSSATSFFGACAR